MTEYNAPMVAALALVVPLIAPDRQSSFLAKDTLPKPSVTLLVDHVVPAPKGHPKVTALEVKFPTNVHVGSENFVFEGPRGGRVTVRVAAEGSKAKATTSKSMTEIEKSFEKMKGRLDFKYFVAKPWFGTIDGPNTAGDRHVDNYTAMRVDGSLVIKVDASWEPRNAKGEQEATELARFVIWTAEAKAGLTN